METSEPVAAATKNGDCKGYAQVEHFGEEALCLYRHIVQDGLMCSSTQKVTTITMRNYIRKWHAQHVNLKPLYDCEPFFRPIADRDMLEQFDYS